MRISVHYSTVYHYDFPVHLEPHIFRLRPRANSSQFDPSRGLAVTDGHIAVAAGFDHDLAAPVAGWYSGGAQSRMEASLSLRVEQEE